MAGAQASVAALYSYPIKSMRGVRRDTLDIADGRPDADRLWLLVDEDGRFMHQRDFPQMARVEIALFDESVRADSPGLPSLSLARPDRAPSSGDPHGYVKLWRRSAAVRRVSAEADDWFTAALGVSCRLMAFVPDRPALTAPSYEAHSSLQDATPFHLISLDSLEDLNRRTSVHVPADRFRANIVVAGNVPYDEDRWRELEIGTAAFQWVKPCTRCVATTTDQQTGARIGNEPLRALSRYRRMGPTVVFGHYVIGKVGNPPVSIGDPVTVTATAT